MITNDIFEMMRAMPVFKPEMRAANREGLKGQTRRVIDLRELRQVITDGILKDSFFYRDKRGTWQNNSADELLKKCPYGKAGDFCYMREPLERTGKYAFYKDDNAPVTSLVTGEWLEWRWKKDILTSIFMPKEAARFVYQYTSIRVERVQDISEEDAIAEGVVKNADGYFSVAMPEDHAAKSVSCNSAVGAYQVLFDHINLKRGFGWDSNPWVWVLGYAPSALAGTSPILEEHQNGGGSAVEMGDAPG